MPRQIKIRIRTANTKNYKRYERQNVVGLPLLSLVLYEKDTGFSMLNKTSNPTRTFFYRR